MKGELTMKLYQYFRKEEGGASSNVTSIEEIPLYAITTNKDHARAFERSRDMDIFIKKVFKGAKEDCIDYINRHRGYLLDYYEISTYDNSGREQRLLVLMSDVEFELIDFENTHLRVIDEIEIFNPTIFKDKYLRDLLVLGYATIAVCKISGDVSRIKKFMDNGDISMTIDELNYFVHLFSDTLDMAHFSEEILDYSELDE